MKIPNSDQKKTVLGGVLELIESLNLPTSTRPTEASLNFKFGLFPDERPTETKTGTIKYVGIGIKGYRNIDDKQGSAPYKVDPKACTLYQMIPIVIVPIDEDLSDAERAKYRMRVKENINGQDYIAYYLKVVEPTDDGVMYISKDLITSGVENVDINDILDLSPVPNEVLSTEAQSYSKMLMAYSSLKTTIYGKDVINTINLKHENVATQMSEIGLFSGEDKEVTSPFDNVTYTESIYTNLRVHKTTQPAMFISPEDKRDIDLLMSSSKAHIK